MHPASRAKKDAARDPITHPSPQLSGTLPGRPTAVSAPRRQPGQGNPGRQREERENRGLGMLRVQFLALQVPGEVDRSQLGLLPWFSRPLLLFGISSCPSSFRAPWTIYFQAPLSWVFCKNTGMISYFPLRESSPQRSNSHAHCLDGFFTTGHT